MSRHKIKNLVARKKRQAERALKEGPPRHTNFAALRASMAKYKKAEALEEPKEDKQ